MGPPPFSGSKHSKLALNEHSESGHQKTAQKLVAHSWQKIRKASNPLKRHRRARRKKMTASGCSSWRSYGPSPLQWLETQ